MSDIVERARRGEDNIDYANKLLWECSDEIKRLRAAGNAAFLAMCAYRENGDQEVFQAAIDALGVALEPAP